VPKRLMRVKKKSKDCKTIMSAFNE
jgi:hypothetical protein